MEHHKLPKFTVEYMKKKVDRLPGSYILSKPQPQSSSTPSTALCCRYWNIIDLSSINGHKSKTL